MENEKEEDVSSYWMTFRKGYDTEFETGSTRWHSVRTDFGRSCGPVLRQTV
jgi:hypothetical protein